MTIGGELADFNQLLKDKKSCNGKYISWHDVNAV
jgi:hypothetical protein